MPSTWTTAGIRSRQPSRTWWVKSMYGLGSGPPSKSSAARSASTMGATGRNCSRPLTSLSRSSVAGIARVGEQAAVTEGPRPELAAALEPGDDPVGGELLGDRLGDVVGALVGDRRAVEPGGQLVVVPAAPEGGGRHRRRPVAQLGGDLEGRAQRRAGVARGRLHPDVAKRALAPQPRVGHAVERHAAGERQARLARLLVQPAGEVDEHLLQPALHGRGEVGVRGQPVGAVAQPRVRSEASRRGRCESRRRGRRARARGRRRGARASRRTPAP